MLTFGRVLPTIRAAVQHDLALPGLPKRKVLAALVGAAGAHDDARRQRGVCPHQQELRPDHAADPACQGGKGGHLTFDFRGKHGVQHHIDLDDRRLAKVVERCRDLPGQDLFQFLDRTASGITSCPTT